MNVQTLTVEALKQLLDEKRPPVLLDVREAHERDICVLNDQKHIPLNALPERYQELNPDVPVVVYCRSGMRSLQAAAFLMSKGFKDVKNLTGGILAWAQKIDPNMPTY